MKVDRPDIEESYGVPKHLNGLLDWSYVEERMATSRNYWIVTADKNGKPAVSPVWGVWYENKLYFDGSQNSRRGRNISANQQVSVHLEDGTKALIMDGTARIIKGVPDPEIAKVVSEGYCAKYKEMGYEPGPDMWDNGGLFVFIPEKVLAWTKFFDDATRWRL